MMNRIKAVIFDLDDTLLDTTGQIKDKALREAVKAMIDKGMNCSGEEGFKTVKEIIKTNPSANKFNELAKKYKAGSSAADAGKKAYNSVEIKELHPFPGAINVLKEIEKDYDLALISTGRPEQQNKKIDLLGIRGFFDTIIINQKETKEECFARALKALGVNSQRVLCVGDRVDIDIKAANRLGMVSLRVLLGGYKELKPKNEIEEPDYTVTNLKDVPGVLSKIQKVEDKLAKGPKIVVIGGGTGSPTILEGLKQYTNNLSSVITITDRGRSSGALHKELNVLPPGDIRNNLVALADSEELLYDLFQYRFEQGSLKGHSFGNLLLAALTKITGNFEKAIKEASKLLNLKGGVFPSTLEDTNICAELEEGTILHNEQEIVVKGDAVDKTKRAKIKNVFINPKNAPANTGAVETIEEADLIVIGPGSLYTSVMPNLLVEGIRDAVKRAKAKKAYICNIVTQPGQTEGFKASDHVKEIVKYLGENILDYAIINSEMPPKKLIKQYEKENSFLVENDAENIEKIGVKVISDNLIEDIKEKKLLWEKQSLLRHDSQRIAEILIRTIGNGNSK